MKQKPKISVIIRTVSKDNFLFEDYGILSAIQMYVTMFENQTFKDFELILVDHFYEENKEYVENIKTSFVFKHVPVHENHNYWSKQGYTCGSGFKNTGLLYADGTLVIYFDDGEIISPKLIGMYWYYYTQGLFLHAFHLGTKNPIVINNKLTYPYYDKFFIKDSRDSQTKSIHYHNYGSWLYAGACHALTDLLDLNGFDEKMDGYQGGQDTNMGLRLEGIGRKFVLDKTCYLTILLHKSYKDCDYGEKSIREIFTKDNYGFIDIVRQLKQYKANNKPLTSEELKLIDDATLKFRNFKLNYNDENVVKWLNTPNFNLIEERKQLRKSKNWRW